MRLSRTLILLNILFFISPIHAGSMGALPENLSLVTTFSVGPVWQSNGEDQTLLLTPEIEKAYIADKSTNTLTNLELFAGVQNTANIGLFSWQAGLALGFAGNARLTGVIWDDALPAFENFSYAYSVQHAYLGLKGKLLAQTNYPSLMPWLSASLGLGVNRAFNYSSTPLIFEALPTPDFSSHTQATFSYTLGAGVQYVLVEDWQIGIGYEFADWGKSQLGRAAGQSLGEGLNLDHLYTNGLLLNITWVPQSLL